MLKSVVKSFAERRGIYVCNPGRLGIDLNMDLNRFSADQPLGTIFDVGGNFGQTANDFASAFPSAQIFSFEPVPSSFARLQEAVKSLKQVKAFNIALGDKIGTVKINLTSDAAQNSIKYLEAAEEALEIPVDTIDHIAIENQIENIDLLKIDVEGYELPVLKGATRCLQEGRIRFVYAECVLSPNSEMPHTSFFDIHTVLTTAGFCFVNYYAESFNLRLGCATGNVLYALRTKLPTHVPGRIHNIV